MRQLHVLGVSEDGSTLLLGTTKNAKPTHRIPLDDRLLRATRGQLVVNGDRAESALSPKEIQARLRAGATPEEVAKAAGVPVARVLPYFAPVEAERDRIVDEARAAVMHRHRGPDATRPLGQVVDAHLADVTGLKTDTVVWTSRRRGDGAWIVAVSYSARGGRRKAEWLWQPAGKALSPLDPAAARLGTDAPAAPAKRRTTRTAAKPAATRPATKTAAAKKAPSRKAAAKKKSPAVAKPVAKRAAAKTVVVPKAPDKKAADKKPAVTKAPVKKAPVKKAAVKKAAVQKAATTKAAPRRADAARKPAPKPTPVRRAVRRPAPTLAAVVRVPKTTARPPVRKPARKAATSPQPVTPTPVLEPVVELVPEPVPTPVPTPEPEPTRQAEPKPVAPAAQAAPERPARKPGQRVPLPSWSEVLLGVTGSRESDSQNGAGGDNGGRRAG